MNILSIDKRALIFQHLIEGCSMRSTTRLTGAAKKTVERLLVSAGTGCAELLDRLMVDLSCKRLECDEIWSFCYAKEKNVPTKVRGKKHAGDTWLWVAIDPDTKLIPSWRVGSRNATDAYWFMHDVAKRLKSRVQLTCDGHAAYLEAVESAFGSEVDFAQLIKLYGNELTTGAETRYSPAACVGSRKIRVSGSPIEELVSTSICERSNLTIRMSSRRFTRLTNGFSKKVENHGHACAMHFAYYNLCRIHSTIRVTPAMEAGVSDHVWSVEELIEKATIN